MTAFSRVRDLFPSLSLRLPGSAAQIALPVIIVVLSAFAFSRSAYDWDIDHEMYFGGRLLAGELIWTSEFHDKLPFIQFFFALPAYFHSVTVVRLMTLTLAVAAVVALVRLLPAIVGSASPSPETSRIVLFGALLFLALQLAVTGDITSINTASSSLAVLSTVMILHDAFGKPRFRLALIAAGCLAGAAAISLRPYFIAPLAVVTIWSAVELSMARATASKAARISSAVWFLAAWGCGFLLWGLLLNVTPYLAAGHMSSFVEGLSMLTTDINPESAILSLWNSASSPQKLSGISLWCVASLLFGSGALLAFGYQTGQRASRLSVMTAVAIISLIALVLRQHYWAHYIAMFTGYACLLVVFSLCAVKREEPGAARRGVQLGSGLLIAGALAVIAVLTVFQTAATYYRVGRDHPSEWVVRAIRDYRADAKGDSAFLLPSGASAMYAHWRLDEPRHGFPHAAHVQHIWSGWFKNAGTYASFSAPQDEQSFCRLLSEKGPAAVVTIAEEYPFVASCFESSGSAYRRDRAVSGENGQTLLFFVRKP